MNQLARVFAPSVVHFCRRCVALCSPIVEARNPLRSLLFSASPQSREMADAFADEVEPTMTINEYIEGLEAEELVAIIPAAGSQFGDVLLSIFPQFN